MRNPAALLLVVMAASAQTPPGLDQTRWRLVEAKGAAFTLPANQAVTLAFQADRVSAKACNTMGGQSAFDGATVRVSRMASTMMACAGDLMEVDAALADVLKEATYRVDGNRLTLTGKDGSAWVFEKQPSPAAPVAPAGSAAPLDHTKWQLIEAKGAGFALPAERPVTLTFAEGVVMAKACNSMRGRPVFERTTIRAGVGASTRMACPGDLMNIDAALAVLLREATYRVEGHRLTLTGQTGGDWVFEKQPYPSRDAKTKFIYVASETKDCGAGAGKMKCLQVRDSPDQPWRLNYNPIIGFEHRAGVEYRLRIKEDVVENPPADASRFRWYLDLIVEQRLVRK